MPKKKILVFCNRKDSFNLCKALLKDIYFIVNGGNGTNGLQRAVVESPDLILLDLSNEFESGLSFCSELGRNEVTCGIPVIILYDSAHREAIVKTEGFGVTGHIPKPIVPTLLIKRIQTAIERYPDSVIRCPDCLKVMQAGWVFCPYDGTRLS